jgi:hypothetical protein
MCSMLIVIHAQKPKKMLGHVDGQRTDPISHKIWIYRVIRNISIKLSYETNASYLLKYLSSLSELYKFSQFSQKLYRV